MEEEIPHVICESTHHNPGEHCLRTTEHPAVSLIFNPKFRFSATGADKNKTSLEADTHRTFPLPPSVLNTYFSVERTLAETGRLKNEAKKITVFPPTKEV